MNDRSTLACWWKSLCLALFSAAFAGGNCPAIADDASASAPVVSPTNASAVVEPTASTNGSAATGAATNTATQSPDSTAQAPALPAPLLSTNSATSSFLESHPELAQPVPSEPQDLTLRPAPPGPAPAPEITVHTPEAPTEPPPFPNATDQPDDLAAHLLVVYNANDPDSKPLADYYAFRRNIPAERVLALACPVTEEITRRQYEDTIRVPIMSYLSQKNWIARKTTRVHIETRTVEILVATRNDIWAIVLIRGVPLKIAADGDDQDAMQSQPELQTNAAAVDSELAVLPIFGLPYGGYVPNPFFDGTSTGLKRVGPDLARDMILVTRLDGPKPSDVRRMIDDSIFAEQHRLAGLAVVDTRGLTDVNDGYTTGDIWLRGARDALVRDGWLVKFDDKPDVLPPTDPCNHVAIYMGWYSGGASGPWVTAPDRFVPGAIAYHLHSFSASTVRSETANWVGPLIAHGADATMGMVYEPFLAMTPHEDIFVRHMLSGNYFAEAAYAAQRGLSWMVTVVGDPLYRPFRLPLSTALAEAQSSHTPQADWLLLQQVQRKIIAGQINGNADGLTQAIDIPGSGSIAEEGLGDLLEKLNDPLAAADARTAYKKALAGDIIPVDRVRVGLKLAQDYSSHGQDARAQAELDLLRELYPEDAKRFGVADPLVPTNLPPGDKSAGPPSLPGPPQLPQPTPSH